MSAQYLIANQNQESFKNKDNFYFFRVEFESLEIFLFIKFQLFSDIMKLTIFRKESVLIVFSHRFPVRDSHFLNFVSFTFQYFISGNILLSKVFLNFSTWSSPIVIKTVHRFRNS